MNTDDEKIKQVFQDMEIRRASTDTDYSVVMANDMVKGCSELSLNELKLLRTIIMQIKPEDKELYTYKISIKDFQSLIGVSSKKIYSEAQKMCIHLLKEVILIGDGNPEHKWEAFQWVSYCKYDSGEITIRLNDSLKPYILGLQRFYTQFKLEDIVRLNSTYSIRLLELILEAMKSAPVYANQTTEVYIPVDIIRKATNTENKYISINMFRERVIDSAVNELNSKSRFYITVREYKASRKIVGYYFKIESSAFHIVKAKNEKKQVEKQPDGQMSLEDYFKDLETQEGE